MNNITKVLLASALVMPQVAWAGYQTATGTAGSNPRCTGVYTDTAHSSCSEVGLTDDVNNGGFLSGVCNSVAVIRGFYNNDNKEHCINSCTGVASGSSYILKTYFAQYIGMNGQNGCFVPFGVAEHGCTAGSTTTQISQSHSKIETVTSDCVTTTKYACNIGWYGNPTNESGGCEPCPQPDNWTASEILTPGVGTTAVQACYIAQGTAFSDATGSGVLTSDCRYPQ